MKSNKGQGTGYKRRLLKIDLARVTVIFIFLLILGSLTGCGSSGETLERIQADGVMRVGLDPTFPPFENGDEGILEGIDIDLANAIGREMGVRVEFVYLGYDGLYDALLIDQTDVLISALIIDPAKTKDFAYSAPYFNVGQVLVIRRDSVLNTSSGSAELADLEGKTISVETGSEGHVEAIAAKNTVRDLTIKTLPTPADAMWLVLQGETDAALVDQANARLYLQTLPDLTYAQRPITVEPYAIVTRKDDSRLLDKLNQILEELSESGELEEIISRWLDGSS
ncbi:MAG: ABC transporter substrate-binding protein [Anaerolineae bacterium]